MAKVTRATAPKKVMVGLTLDEHRGLKARAAIEGKTLEAFLRELLLLGLASRVSVVYGPRDTRGSLPPEPFEEAPVDDEPRADVDERKMHPPTHGVRIRSL